MTATMGAQDRFGWVGQTIASKLRVDAVVAEGGFAVVYRAYHLGFGERVALKCLKVPAQLDGIERERFLRAFLDEGKLLHRLSRSSSGIVQALDIGADVSPSGAWTPYLALEWLEGVSLADDMDERTRRGAPPRTLAEVLELLDSAAAALSLAHAEGVAHRDIKPSNLVLAQLGERRITKVVDFGIAKVMKDATTTTRAHAMTGVVLPAFSPRYGAPEQFDRGYGATGPWTDVFAFALVIVELLTGRPALEGEEPLQIFVAAANPERRPTPRALGANVSDAVERVLARAVSVEPEQRHRNIGELWRELAAAAKEEDAVPQVASVAALSAPLAAPATNVSPTHTAPRLVATSRAKPTPRRGRVAGRIGVASVIAAAAVLVGVTFGGVLGDSAAPDPRATTTAASAVSLTSAWAGPRETAPSSPQTAPRPVPATASATAPTRPDRAARGETIRASHILVQYDGASSSNATRSKDEARARAEEVLRSLQAGASFEHLAAVYGDDATRTRGGNLGEFGRGKFPAEFTRAAFALRPGEHSGIVETRYGFHIVLRTE